MAKKDIDVDKLIAQQAKENAALKAKIAQKEARANRELEEQVDQSNEILNIQQKYNDALDVSKKSQKEIRDLSAEINEYIEYAHANKETLTKEEKKEVGLLIKNLKLQKDAAKDLNKQAITQQKIAKIEEKALPHRKKLIESQTKLNKLEDKYKDQVEESFEFIGDIDDQIKKIPIVGGFLSKAIGLDKFQEELTEKFTGKLAAEFDKNSANQKKAAEEALKGYDSQIDKLNGVEEAAGEVTGSVGDIGPTAMKGAEGATAIEGGLTSAIPAAGGLMASLGPILPILLAIAAAAYLVEKALDMDKEVTEMARGLGMSKHEAMGIHEELIHIAEDTEVVGASAEAMGAAYMDLAKGLGVTKLASAEMAESQVLLTKQMGMATDEAVAFQKMSLASGKTSEQNLAIIKAGTEAASGGLFNYKEIAKEIAMTGADIQAGYKGDIKLLTKAVNTAKKLGITMEQAKGISDSLLDVESSLQNEMTAQVLTGKTLNLDSARQLALQGDIAGAAAETLNQVGGMAEYNNMNVVQQEALAKAAGMARAELAESLKTQEAQRSIAESLGIAYDTNHKFTEKELAAAEKLGNKEAKKLMLQQQQAAATEKMSKLGDKLMAIMMKVAEPIVEMLDPLMEMIDFIFPALEVVMDIAFTPLKWAFKLISAIIKGVGKVGSFLGSLFGGGDDKSNKISKEKKTEVHDAMISPDGGLEVSGAKGTYSLDKNDTVIAGTSLGDTSNSNTPETGILGGIASAMSAPFEAVGSLSGGGNDNSEVAALLRELIAKVEQPVNINISNKTVDTLGKQVSLRKTYASNLDQSYGVKG